MPLVTVERLFTKSVDLEVSNEEYKALVEHDDKMIKEIVERSKVVDSQPEWCCTTAMDADGGVLFTID